MKTTLGALTTAATLLGLCGLGLALPSCPGQQALQQQVDAMATTTADLSRKYQALDAHDRATAADVTQMKQLLAQAASAIQAQKTALDQLDATAKDLQARIAALEVKKGRSKHRARR